jgi:hypothetical protein
VLTAHAHPTALAHPELAEVGPLVEALRAVLPTLPAVS